MWIIRTMLGLPTEAESKRARPERLADIMALIQVLAMDKHAHRSESGLLEELQRRPESTDTWTTLAREHPEFFRVECGRGHPLSLVARHVTPRDRSRAATIPPDFVAGLLNAAIDIHDRRNGRCQRWIYLIPIWVALIGFLGVVVAAVVRVFGPNPGCPS